MCSRLVLVSLLLCVSGCLWTQAQTGSEGASTSETQGQSAQGNSSSSGKQQEDKRLGGSTEGKIKIDTVNPDSAASGEAIEIKGSSFGKQGKVWVKDQEATVSSWKSDQILAVVPDGIPAGEATVMVQPDRQDKTTYQGTFKVKPSPYDKTAFQILTGVGASFLPIETTSYKVDSTSNSLSQTNVGRKHLELLVGGAFIIPWKTIYKKQGETDPDYKSFHPLEAFLSLRFAPGADQTFTGFVVGGGWRVHKYFSLLMGYSLTPIEEPTSGFRRAATQVVTDNPKIFPYSQYNASDLAQNKPGAFDGFPLFLYNSTGVTTTKIFPTSPTVTHARSGIFFGVGIPLNLGALLKPGSSK